MEIKIWGIDNIDGDKVYEVTMPDGSIFYTNTVDAVLRDHNGEGLTKYDSIAAYEKYWVAFAHSVRADAVVRVIPLNEYMARGHLAAH